MANENVMADLINDGSSFGVIFIANNIDNFFNDRRKTKQQLIRSILERKSGLDFIRFIEANASEFNFHKKIINNGLPFGIIFIVSDPENLIDINDKNKKLESCFHYNENEKPFNLKQHLLELKKELGFEPSGIFYCENASTHKIELISNEPKDFKGVLLEFSQITSLSPNELPQFLANFKFSKSTYGIDKAEFSLSSLSLENMTLIDNLSTLKRNIKNTFDRYSWHGYSKIPQEKRITQIKKQVSEECKVNPFFHSWRVSSEQNRKVNKIAEDLKSGKIVGEKIIDNVFDINASLLFYHS